LLERGKPSLFLIKSDPVVERLAAFYDLPVVPMGKKGKGLLQKYLYQLRFLWKSVSLARSMKAELGLGVSMTLPLVSKYSKMDSITFDDDDMAITPVFARYANKAQVVLTPDALRNEQRGPHHIPYPGYHELAYLHPNRFTPDPAVFDLLGISRDEPYFVVRFNAFVAHHDTGEGGMSFDQKKRLVERLQQAGRVFISAEAEMDPAFSELLLPDRPELMHSFLAWATLYVGESQTMTSEAAVLGTPALKCNTFAGRLSVPNELEKQYGLCYAFLPEDFDRLLTRIDELLSMEDLKGEWQKRRNTMLKDKIDVTAFLVWLVERYPECVEEMKQEGEVIFSRWRAEG
jgi:predicted glycosyltransferase